MISERAAAAGAALRRRRGRRQRTERLVAPVGVGHELGMNEAALEVALHRDDLPLHDSGAVFAQRPELDQRAPGIVLEDELVAEDLGHGAFHRDHVVGLHLGDRDRRQQEDLRGLPVGRRRRRRRRRRGHLGDGEGGCAQHKCRYGDWQ
ncbi:MAG: hypothetical protein K2X72_17440 [Reyranella sp.]|nr:hypothetical protein [Reyranella sp.]